MRLVCVKDLFVSACMRFINIVSVVYEKLSFEIQYTSWMSILEINHKKYFDIKSKFLYKNIS